MGLANRFWKLMGSTQGRDTSRAQSAVEASHEYDGWAAGLDDGEFADTAHDLQLFGDPPEDLARFLALAREAADRTVGLRPFDVQLQGALRMFSGDVVEMATGEGKTLSGAVAAAR